MGDKYRPGDFCCIRGCERPIKSIGFCSAHYARWRRHGHPLGGLMGGAKARNGFSQSERREAHSYYAARDRCTNSKHKQWAHYGGRGIRLCDRWLRGNGVSSGLQCFLADMGEAPIGTTLDRVNVNGDYEPGNCRWATSTEQNRNKRDVVLNAEQVVTARLRHRAGESIAAIGRDIGVGYITLYQAVRGTSWADIPGAVDGR